MKRLGGVWAEVTSFTNLYRAYSNARKGKQSREAVANFTLNLEEELFALQQELESRTYQHGGYRQFMIYDRKPRLISAAPFRDRVVHHALMNVVEPYLDRRMIYHSYACRRDKGVHRAVDQYQQWAGCYAYVLKLDVSRYFPSIDQALLKQMLRRHIKDQSVLWLADSVIDSANGLPHLQKGKGLPIGNLTSQVMANLYLNALDHWLQALPDVHYLRYVDDLFVLGNAKAQLWLLAESIEQRLSELALRVAPGKVTLQRTAEKVDVLGYQITASRRWLRNDNGYRARRRLQGLQKAYATSQMDLQQVQTSVASWIGHSRHGETERLREQLFDGMVFRRAL